MYTEGLGPKVEKRFEEALNDRERHRWHRSTRRCPDLSDGDPFSKSWLGGAMPARGKEGRNVGDLIIAQQCEPRRHRRYVRS